MGGLGGSLGVVGAWGMSGWFLGRAAGLEGGIGGPRIWGLGAGGPRRCGARGLGVWRLGAGRAAWGGGRRRASCGYP